MIAQGASKVRKNSTVNVTVKRSRKPIATSAGPSAVAVQFGQVRTRRVFEEICEQVRREMAAGTLRPGDKLPTERDLAVKFGVSRTAVRDALRSLEVAGVVGLQKGPKGGAFILTGDPDLITRSMRDLFHLRRISLDSLTEARTMIMQMTIELASARMTPDILAALKQNYEKLTRLPTSGPASNRIALSAEFYSLLAQATHNEVLKVIVEALTAIVLQQVEKFRMNTLPDLIVHRRRLIRFLATHDASGAKREITEHLRRLHKHLNREERIDAKRQTTRDPSASTFRANISQPSS